MKHLFFILIAMPLAAFAQTQAWTLRQCMDTALHKNITILQSENQVKMSAIDLHQSKANRLPTFNVSANQSFGSGRTLNLATYQFTNDNIWGNQFSLSSTITLFNGFQNQNAIQQNQVNQEKSQADLEDTKNGITLALLNAYLQVLFANELHLNAQKQAESTSAQMKRTQELFDAGLKPKSDVLLLKAQLAGDQLSEINSRNQLKTAKLALQQLMNITPSETFDIQYTPVPETSLVLSQEVNSIYQQSLQYQPSVQSSLLNIQSTLYGIRKAKGALFPTLSLNGNLGTTYSSASKISALNYRSTLQNIGYLQSNPDESVMGPVTEPFYTYSKYPFTDQLKDYLNGSLSLSLSIPIANKNQVRNNIARQQILYENAQLNDEYVKRDLRKNIEQAYLDAENAAEKMNATRVQLEATKAAWQSINDRYENGLVNVTDLIAEKNKHAVAQSNYLQARYELLFRIKILDYYRGIPIDL
jgi:outer membrane protein